MNQKLAALMRKPKTTSADSYSDVPRAEEPPLPKACVNLHSIKMAVLADAYNSIDKPADSQKELIEQLLTKLILFSSFLIS